MEITITGTDTIQHVKDEFHRNFENLKIEFFYHGHEVGEGSPASDMVKGDMALENIRDKEVNGHITYDETMTVAEFEQLFEDDFGLHVQIFRRASKAWLESITTDHWTLKDANHMAKENYQDA